MVDIQSTAAEIRQGIKKERRRKKSQGKNIMVCPITATIKMNTGIRQLVQRFGTLLHYSVGEPDWRQCFDMVG